MCLCLEKEMGEREKKFCLLFFITSHLVSTHEEGKTSEKGLRGWRQVKGKKKTVSPCDLAKKKQGKRIERQPLQEKEEGEEKKEEGEAEDEEMQEPGEH